MQIEFYDFLCSRVKKLAHSDFGL